MTLSLKLNLADILEAKYPHGFTVPADIDIANVIEFGDDDWDHSIDVDAHFEGDCVILPWSVDDVLARRSDLNTKQAWQVLTQARKQFLEDRCHLDFLEVTANRLFPIDADVAEIVKERLRSLLAQVEATPSDFLANWADIQRTREHLDALEEALNAGDQP
jgi:hypothetical protein